MSQTTPDPSFGLESTLQLMDGDGPYIDAAREVVDRLLSAELMLGSSEGSRSCSTAIGGARDIDMLVHGPLPPAAAVL